MTEDILTDGLQKAAARIEQLEAQLAAVGTMLKTGGMNDGYFMAGQVRGLLEILTERDQTIARLTQERDEIAKEIADALRRAEAEVARLTKEIAMLKVDSRLDTTSDSAMRAMSEGRFR